MNSVNLIVANNFLNAAYNKINYVTVGWVIENSGIFYDNNLVGIKPIIGRVTF